MKERSKRKKRQLRNDIRRTFGKSRGRFASIVALIALGAFALVGLKVAGPDMRATAEHFVGRQDLADLEVIGDLGLDADDEAEIERASGIRAVEYGYLKDVIVAGSHDAIRVWSRPQELSTFEVVEGRLPEAVDEVALDADLAKDHPVGSTFNVSEKAAADGSNALKRHGFTVVGVVNSAEIVSDVNRGATQSGTGSLAGYAVVAPEAFDVDYHMVARVAFEDTEGLDPFGQDYLDRVATHKEELEKVVAGQPEHRLEAVRAQYQDAIDEGRAKVDDARAQLADTKATLDAAAAQLESGRAQIAASEGELADASGKLVSARAQLEATWAQLGEAKETLDATPARLDAARGQLESAASQLVDGRTQLAQKQAEHDAGVAALASAREDVLRQFEAAQSGIDASRGKLEDAKAAYERQLAELRERLDAAQAAGDKDAAAHAQQRIDQVQEAYDRFLNADADPDAAGEDGGYTALISQLDASQAQLEAKRQAADQEFAAKQSQLDEAAAQLSAAGDALAQKQAAYDAAKASYAQGVASYNEGLSTYRAGLASWKDAAEQLASKAGEYGQGEARLESARAQLAAKQAEYEDGLAAYEDALPDAEAQIADGEADLADARLTLAELETPAYNVYTRREAPGSEGYRTYDSVSEIVDSLANIFPYFLYLVAALVASTTMARMVDEERIGAGTLKALGYGDADVMAKFVVYGASAAVLGTLVGVVLGHTLLPLIVYNAYGPKYVFPRIELHVNVAISLACLALALVVTVVPAWLVVRCELAEKPAALLLPKPPAAGSKILLERVRPIWSRLSFMGKVTARNIFRYKKRALMTVVGVAGAVCLMFTGFGVRRSVSGIASEQFGKIIGYDLIVAKNAHVDGDEQDAIDELLDSDDVEAHAGVTYEALTKVAGAKGDAQEVSLLVPEDADGFGKYLDLRDRETGEKLSLDGGGAVVSERLAELADVGVGDTLTFKDSAGTERRVRVGGICEMYVNHFMFMDRDTYAEVFGEDASVNAYVATLMDGSLTGTEDMAARFMELAGVKGVVQSASLINMVDVIVASLNKIMGILIGLATLLAIVIVYNLVTINVSERIRELSTVKVLGFFTGEVTMYIYRETILLSVLAVPVGWGLGRLLQLYIIDAVPPETVMFDPACGALPFVVSATVVAVVVGAMYLVVRRRLRRVDMLEALKSVD